MITKFSEMFSIYRKLNRSVYILFIARIVNSAGSFVFPFLTLYLTEKIGLSPSKAGLYILLSAAFNIPGALVGGKLADLTGRKNVILIGQLSGTVMLFGCAFTTNPLLVPWLLILASSFFAASGPATRAMLTDLSTPETRQGVFSLLYLGNNIGFAAGPIIAGFLYANHAKWLFLGDGATTLVAVVLVFYFISETKPDEKQLELVRNDNPEERAETGNFITVFLSRPFLVWFVAIDIVISFVYAQMNFGLPLQMSSIFQDRGPVLYGSVMTFNGVIVIFFTALVIALTTKAPPLLNVIFSALLFGAGFGMIYFLRSPFLFFVAAFIYTIGEILWATNAGVYIANHTPISHRGRINSIIPILTGIGNATSPALMGIVIERSSVNMIWVYTFFLSIGASAALLVLFNMERGKLIRTGKT